MLALLLSLVTCFSSRDKFLHYQISHAQELFQNEPIRVSIHDFCLLECYYDFLSWFIFYFCSNANPKILPDPSLSFFLQISHVHEVKWLILRQSATRWLGVMLNSMTIHLDLVPRFSPKQRTIKTCFCLENTLAAREKPYSSGRWKRQWYPAAICPHGRLDILKI